MAGGQGGAVLSWVFVMAGGERTRVVVGDRLIVRPRMNVCPRVQARVRSAEADDRTL
jgi:hypothetical protein